MSALYLKLESQFQQMKQAAYEIFCICLDEQGGVSSALIVKIITINQSKVALY